MSSKKRVGNIRETPITDDAYALLPNNGDRYELDNGFLELMNPSASVVHQIANTSDLLYRAV